MTQTHFLLLFAATLLSYTSAQHCHPVTEKTCLRSDADSALHRWRYNATSYPNLRGLNSAHEVAEKFELFFPLIKTGCSAHFELFACALHQPACTAAGVVLPCRELCALVHDGCQKAARDFGISWPQDLIDCAQLPEYMATVEAAAPVKEDSDEAASVGHGSTLVSRSAYPAWDRALLMNGMASFYCFFFVKSHLFSNSCACSQVT